MIVEIAVFVTALALGIMWGMFENRVWEEHGESWILGHFKTYHLLMALLFGTFNAFATLAIFYTFTLAGFLTWLWLMIYDTLILDVVWWVIRYMDITHLGQTWYLFGRPIYKFPDTNTYDGGTGKPWHSIYDWDNWLGLPLVGINGFECYWWWWCFSGLLMIIGGVSWIV